MAVEAQQQYHLSKDASFAPDFRNTRIRSTTAMEEQQQQQQRMLPLGVGLPGLYNGAAPTCPQQQIFMNATVFSDPESDLTCINATASRKRTREQQQQQQPPMFQQSLLPSSSSSCLNYIIPSPPPLKKMAVADTTTTISLLEEQSRLNQSSMTSTSGRPHAVVAAAVSPFWQDLVSHFNHQNVEIDALIRFQNEKLRYGLEEMRRKQCRTLLFALEQQVQRRLKEKDAELQTVSRRNAELEEKVRQIAAENQIWFNMAKNNEAIASSLRSTLDQALLQQNNSNCQEGFGDSEGRADDAHSCCFETTEEEERTVAGKSRRTACKVCGAGSARVLVLPCRHLCLCNDCESKVDTCPVCNSVKNASLQIFMS